MRGEGGNRRLFAGALFLLLLAGLFAFRHGQIIAPLARELTCGTCLWLPHVLTDAVMLGLAAALFGLGLWLKARWARLLVRLLVLALLLAYLLDIYVYRNFHVRLDLRDVVVYGDQLRLAWNQFVQSLPWPVLSMLAVAALLAVAACLWLPRKTQRASAWWMGAPVLVVLVALAIDLWRAPAFPSRWIVRNVLAHNLQTGVAVPYDEEHRDRLADALVGSPPQCLAGSGWRPNVVVLIAEGWSPYHSKLFSGLNDWTPRLDALAAQGRYFTAMHAGGSNTNAGLVSLLAGWQIFSPVKGPLKLAPFDGVWGLESTLPRHFERAGYHSVFMTNGNLAFSRKGDWLADLGFSEIHGHDSPEYEGRRRLNFDAVADEHLYRKALAFTREPSDVPWVMVLENVSSHHPYTHPHTLERDERQAFTYMDQSMDDFIRGLGSSGFLEENLLVVISDHRAMTRVSPQEKSKFGLAASSRIPAFALSGRLEAGRVDTPLHQSDLLPSLVALVGQGACAPRPVQDMFTDQLAQPRCLMHAPNSDWNAVHAYCPGGEVKVALRGSDSRLVPEGSGDKPLPGLLDAVAAARLLPASSAVVEKDIGDTGLAISNPSQPSLPDFSARAVVNPPLPPEPRDPAALPAGGRCNIERLNSHSLEQGTLAFRPASDFAISGWLVDDAAMDIAREAVLVASDPASGRRFRIGPFERTDRPDIVKAFNGKARLRKAGFVARIPEGTLPPAHYELSLLFKGDSGVRVCGRGRSLRIEGGVAAPLASAEGTSPAAGS